MKRRFTLLAVLGLVHLAVAAPPAGAGSAVPPENLSAAIQSQVTARDALAAQAAESQAALRKWYESALDAVKKESIAKGILDGVVAVDAERERIDRDLTPEEKATLPKLLRTARDQYDQARAQRAAQLKANLGASLRAYVTTLDTLEKSLTQKADIEAALATRKERASAAEQLNALTAAEVAPAAPVAAGPPVRPAPARRAPVLSPDSGSAVPVVKVASELKAWGTVQSPAAEALGFSTTDGIDHKKGGRGVLLKNESTKKGSTWSFAWTYANFGINGVQIVHPFGNGQLIVQLRYTGLQPCVAQSWQKDTWVCGGNPKMMKGTAAAEEIFPLKMNQKYTVVSQLSPKGQYTMTIDGKVVYTTSYPLSSGLSLYTSPTPLMLPAGTVGENLPMKWKAGYAALLVGPIVENGLNLCEDITFQASAP